MINETPNNQAPNAVIENWPYEELKGLDKTELERRKLLLDITNYAANKAAEKKKARIDNTRVIALAIVPLLITVITGYFYWKVNRADAERGRLEAQKDLARKAIGTYEEKFISAGTINDSITNASLIANFSNLTNDDDIKIKINKYRTTYDSLINVRNNRQQSLSQQQTANTDKVNDAKKDAPKPTKADSTSLDKSDGANIAAQNARIKNDQPAQAAANNSASQVTRDIPVTLKPAINATKNITDSLLKQFNAPPTKIDETVLKDYGTSWFKEGYFLQFDNMRVLLQYEDKHIGIQVQICETTSSGQCDNPIKTKQWISYDNPLTVTVGGEVYKISLETIDHAGANPFKLAAYIKVVKIKG